MAETILNFWTMKHYDPINETWTHAKPLPQPEQARLAIRAILKRIANPEMAPDVREINLQELRHFRGILMRNWLAKDNA